MLGPVMFLENTNFDRKIQLEGTFLGLVMCHQNTYFDR